MPSDAPTDAPATDYRNLLELEQAQLEAELSELGFDDGKTGLEYDANFADTSQVTAERGEAEALAGKLKDTLEEVHAAIARLDEGTYGTCEVCGEAINPARLEAMPASRFCIKHAASRS
jgi:RNA polymerase-binding transcription factor DksA